MSGNNSLIIQQIISQNNKILEQNQTLVSLLSEKQYPVYQVEEMSGSSSSYYLASETLASVYSESETSASVYSESETSASNTSASVYSASETSASETSASNTSASDVSVSDMSASDVSVSDMSASDTSGSENSSIVTPVKNMKTKKRKTLVELVEIDEEKMCYTSEEIKNMDDYEIIEAFSRVTGQLKLYCGHCKRDTSLNNWLHSIRKRCEKNGLSPELSLPKTCDRQQSVNSICNPINNKVYSVLRSSAPKRVKQIYMDAKEQCFDKIGITVNPHKY
jgi:hypothetical protein